MSILDALEKMMMLEQMNAQGAQQPAPQGYNMMPQQQMMQPVYQGKTGQEAGQQMGPLERGSASALESARNSLALRKRILAMDDEENQRALGKSIIAMRNSMYNNPTYGESGSGNLNAILSGINDGMLHYDQERERIANANNVLLNQQKEEEKQARREALEREKLNHDMDIARKTLSINQGYLGLEKQKRDMELKDHEILTKSGGRVPLSALGKSGWNYAQKYMDQKAERGEAANEAIHSIDEIAQILKDDPHITKNWSIISLAAQRKDPSIVRQKLNSWFIPEERRVRAELLAKNLANLSTGRIKGVSARAMNKMFETWLKEGSPDINMLAGSMIKVLEHDRENNARIFDDWVKSDQAYKEGFFERSSPPEIKSLSDDEVHNLFYGKSSKEEKSSDVEEFRGLLKALKEAKE